ncbi:hypothetical protein CEXT_555921 [Caerostris extrusa]|uniref:Uncharacterized protein n=1 Tax=Caerostris extrusa TaxID=172846 RepID=A0AAV4N8B7_CAEEX|nr:hypothetical protein CEXT_555921 [Caerostris extrusa]
MNHSESKFQSEFCKSYHQISSFLKEVTGMDTFNGLKSANGFEAANVATGPRYGLTKAFKNFWKFPQKSLDFLL